MRTANHNHKKEVNRMPTSMIYSSVPNPPPPGPGQHPENSLAIPVNGQLFQWSPLRLTNFTINMDDNGFGGTVELIGPSSLVNSTLTFQDAPGSTSSTMAR